MRSLTLVYLSMMIKVPVETIVELEKIQKRFIWPSTPKIKNETISFDFKHGGLKNVHINKKIASLQCSWIERLYDDSFYEWKLTPVTLNKKSFGDNLTFHSDLLYNKSYIRCLPCFCKNILLNWKQNLSTDP